MGKPIHLQKPFQLKSRSRDLGHVPFEVFHPPLCSVVLIVQYCLSDKEKTKLSSLNRAKVKEGSHYLLSMPRDPGHALFGVIHHPLFSTCNNLSYKKTKCLASSVQQLWRGSHNLKGRSRDLGHAPFGVIHHSLYTTCSLHRSNKKTRSLQLQPFKSYGGRGPKI